QEELAGINKRLADLPKGSTGFITLTKKANDLKEAIKDNQQALKGLKLDKADADAAARGFKELADAAGDKPGGFAFMLKGLKDGFNDTFPLFGKIAAGARSVGASIYAAL